MSSYEELEKLFSLKVGDIVLYHDAMGYSHTGKIEKFASGKYQYKIENVDEWYKEEELKKISE